MNRHVSPTNITDVIIDDAFEYSRRNVVDRINLELFPSSYNGFPQVFIQGFLKKKNANSAKVFAQFQAGIDPVICVEVPLEMYSEILASIIRDFFRKYIF